MLPSRHSLFRHTSLAGKKRKLFSKAFNRCLHATQVRSKDNSPGPSGTSQFSSDKQAPFHRKCANPIYLIPTLKYGLAEKLADAWRNTPTKWYPLPIFVGALLLVAINYRHRRARSSNESQEKMHVDRDGNERIRLRGPLQVRVAAEYVVDPLPTVLPLGPCSGCPSFTKLITSMGIS